MDAIELYINTGTRARSASPIRDRTITFESLRMRRAVDSQFDLVISMVISLMQRMREASRKEQE